VFEGREQIIVSLGSGLVNPRAPRADRISHSLAEIATDTERIADEFSRGIGNRMANEGCYFRFNVPHIDIEESDESREKDLAHLKDVTLIYVEQYQIAKELRICSTKLAGSASVALPHSVPGRK